MDSPTEAPAADSPSRTFSQVVFTDIPRSYPPSTPITCSFTLTPALKPNSRDWVGIFKVGWSTTKDYHTFVWVEQGLDLEGQSVTRQAVFKEYYLPKDEIEFYQFCYVDNTGQVRGASTPFCFRKPEEGSVDGSLEDDLLIVTTQEQVDQSTREKTELQKELDQIRTENETLKVALEKEQQEADILKGMNAQREKDVAELVKELHEVTKHNEKLKTALQEQQKESDQLKEGMVIQQMKQMELQQKAQSLHSDTAAKEDKYERAVKKINQLKEEREELKEKTTVQSQEINKLNSKLRESERELLKTQDRNQLLEVMDECVTQLNSMILKIIVDLQSSEKDREQLTTELHKLTSLTGSSDTLKTENQELRHRLSQLEALQSSSNHHLNAQCHTLATQLQDALGKLEAERQESRNGRREVDLLEREIQQMREQLENVNTSLDEELRRSSKLEMRFTETNQMIANQQIEIDDNKQLIALMTREKEELMTENQNLKGDIEELRRVIAHTAPDESVYMQPDNTEPNTSASCEQQDTSKQEEHPYDNIGSTDVPQEEEQLLVCRHCQEGFPGITRNELEQHEQSHRVCPFCTLICDNMEQGVFEDHVYSHEL